MRFSFTKKALAALAIAASMLAVSSPAGAEELYKFKIEDERGWISGTPGQEIHFASIDVAPEMRGMDCELIVKAQNQYSRHPGNDLVIRTGQFTGKVEGVEEVAHFHEDFDQFIAVGPAVDFSLVLGSDGLSSMELDVVLDCPDPALAVVATTAPATTTPMRSSPAATVVDKTPEAAPAQAVAGSPSYTG